MSFKEVFHRSKSTTVLVDEVFSLPHYSGLAESFVVPECQGWDGPTVFEPLKDEEQRTYRLVLGVFEGGYY